MSMFKQINVFDETKFTKGKAYCIEITNPKLLPNLIPMIRTATCPIHYIDEEFSMGKDCIFVGFDENQTIAKFIFVMNDSNDNQPYMIRLTTKMMERYHESIHISQLHVAWIKAEDAKNICEAAGITPEPDGSSKSSNSDYADEFLDTAMTIF